MVLENLFNPKLLSPDIKYETSYIDNKKTMKVYAPQTSTQITKTSTSIFNPIDSRQITFVLNSSDVTTKKADKVSGSTSNPEIGATQTPTSSFIPDFGTSSPSVSQSADESSGMSSLLIIGAIVVGAILIFKPSGAKK